MEAVRAPPVEAGLPVRSPVTPARGAGGDVDVPQRHRVTHEESEGPSRGGCAAFPAGRPAPPRRGLQPGPLADPRPGGRPRRRRGSRPPRLRLARQPQGRGCAAVVPRDRPRRRAGVARAGACGRVDPPRRARRRPRAAAAARGGRGDRRAPPAPAARVPRGAGATRAGGAVLRGDRRGGGDPGRDRDVAAGARAAAHARPGPGAGARERGRGARGRAPSPRRSRE